MADRRDVPDSVLFDILLCLPVVSLLRFKTVCKSWRSIIESSVFVTQHLCHGSKDKKGMLMLNSGNGLSFLSGNKYQVHSNSIYEQIFPKTRVEIVNSCNGIVCLAHWIPEEGTLFSLWNPATKQVRQLPKPAVVPVPGKNADHTTAFGFDKEANDYKIVRITLQCGHSGVSPLVNGRIQVYSMRADSRRTIQKGNNFPIAWTKPCVDVAYNGEMFMWIGTSLPLGTTLIFYFDLANEAYGTMPLPDHHGEAHATNLAFINGKIAFVSCRGHLWTTSYYEIWMMDEFGKEESWKKIHKQEAPILPFEGVSVIHLLKNGEFILTIKHSGTDVGLFLYDLVTQVEILLLDVHKVRSITHYSESLVSVKSINLI